MNSLEVTGDLFTCVFQDSASASDAFLAREQASLNVDVDGVVLLAWGLAQRFVFDRRVTAVAPELSGQIQTLMLTQLAFVLREDVIVGILLF